VRPETAEDKSWKKGTAEFLVLAQLERRQSHGYEIAREIGRRSGGALSFNAASLYPVLYRLERRRLISGRWVEKAGQKRRRYYQLTPQGRKALADRRGSWTAFVNAVQRAAGTGFA
jgi:transcriptional regulator